MKVRVYEDYGVEYDQWLDETTNQRKNIQAGDLIQVVWPDGSTTTHSLQINQYTRSEDRDNGYGRWWKVSIDVRMAYFSYYHCGLEHKVFLRNLPESSGISWQKLSGSYRWVLKNKKQEYFVDMVDGEPNFSQCQHEATKFFSLEKAKQMIDDCELVDVRSVRVKPNR